MFEETLYLFRGTTLGYEGGTNCRTYNYTCTTRHPFIGLLFAMECAMRNPDEAVVYIAKLEKVTHLKAEPNVLKKIEQEFVIGVAPANFYPLTEGYIHYKELQEIFKDMGFEVTQIVRKDNLSELCSKVEQMTHKQFQNLMRQIWKVMKSV